MRAVPGSSGRTGGLVLVSLSPFDNALGIDPGPAEDIVVEENTLTGNVPVDVLPSSPELSPFLRDVSAVDVEGNTCERSVPAEVCAP